MRQILAAINELPDCQVFPAQGMPVTPGYEMPEDLSEFYRLCGGVALYEGKDYGLRVVGPTEFVKANPIIRGCDGVGDISYDWFIIAASGEGHITIDLASGRRGRCYDSFWDCHAVRGSCPIIAESFAELLTKLVDTGGEYWYWLREGFAPYGDAYDKA